MDQTISFEDIVKSNSFDLVEDVEPVQIIMGTGIGTTDHNIPLTIDRPTVVLQRDTVANHKRKFGAAPIYVKFFVEDPSGNILPVYLTMHQLKEGIIRGQKQPHLNEAQPPIWT